MSALEELKKINFPSDLDCAVLFYGDDDSEEAQTDAETAANELLDLRSELADKAAELLALRERVAKLENQLKDAQKVAVYFSKLGHGVRPSLGAMRLVRAYEAALKSQ